MEYALSFCGFCGMLLPPGLGLTDNQVCPNCDGDVSDRSNRPEGFFTSTDKEAMHKAYEYKE